MSLKGLKSLFSVVPLFLTMVACSGGAGNGNNNAGNVGNVGNQNDAKQLDVDQRVAKWGQFVGLDEAAAKQELAKAGLAEQVGNNVALDDAQAKAFLELSFAVDKTFAQGIVDLNQRNGQANASVFAATLREKDFLTAQPVLDPSKTPRSLEAKPALVSNTLPVVSQIIDSSKTDSPTLGDRGSSFGDEFREVLAVRQKAVDDYLSMTTQAATLRQRLLDAAQILGFGLEPATARDLLSDSDFKKIRNDFASPIVRGIFGATIVDGGLLGLAEAEKNTKEPLQAASDEQIQFAADPLGIVSFKVGGRFLSFYQFNANQGDDSNSITITNIPLVGGVASSGQEVKPRGNFVVISAEDNAFLSGGDKFPGGIKK